MQTNMVESRVELKQLKIAKKEGGIERKKNMKM